jgi:hypothetical protein
MLNSLSWQPPHRLDENREWVLAEYGEEKGRAILREIQYYNLYGHLPADAVVLERIEWINDSALIIHRDPDEVRQ